MHRIKFFSLFFLLLCFCISCFSQDQVYTNSKNGYSIRYFSDWFVKEDNDNATSIYAPIDGNNDKEFENLAVSISSARGKNVDELYALYIKDFPSAFDEYHSVEEGTWEIQGNKAKWLECTNKNGTSTMTNYLCLIVRNDRLFLLYGLSSTKRFPLYKGKFKAMMMSFKTQ